MKEHPAARPLSNPELSSFCGQMALILSSGISPLEGLSVMSEESSSPEEKKLLKAMEEEYLQSASLYEAFRAAGIFPDYMLRMTHIGEQAGRLDEVMDGLRSHYDREAGIAASLKNAVLYPFAMILMMIAVIFILIIKVLPIFRQVFEQLGQEMTGFSRSVVDFGIALNRYSTACVILFAAAALLFILVFYTKKGRLAAARAASRLGLFRNFRYKTSACRFASAMALTLSSGLDVDQSFEMASGLIDDRDFQEKIRSCREMTRNGEELPKALSQSGIFGGIYARMLAIGFHTGSTEKILTDISHRYEDEVDASIARNISILEPTLVAILSVIVGILLLSVMLPLIGILSGF